MKWRSFWSGVFCVVCAFSVTASPRAQTASSQPAYRVLGAGAAPCAQWSIHKTSRSLKFGDRMWILGYLTRVNANKAAVLANQNIMVTHEDITRDIEDEGIFAWVDKYCIDHPSETIAEAAEGLYAALVNREAEASSATAKEMKKFLELLERKSR
jgi:hypothetical protein